MVRREEGQQTCFSFFRLSSRESTTALYCSTLAVALLSCSFSSPVCSSAPRRRSFSSDTSCWAGEAAPGGETGQ